MTRRRILYTALVFLIGASVVGGAIAVAGPGELANALMSVRPLPLLGMIALTALGFALRALKWSLILGRTSQTAAMFFLSKWAGAWTPARAGEWSPMLLQQHRTMQVGIWITADRLFEIWMTLAFGIAGLWAVPNAGAMTPVLLFVLLVFGTALAFSVARLNLGIAGIFLDMRELEIVVKQHRRQFASLVLLTIAAKATDLLAVQAIALAFGYQVSFLLAALARCSHALVAALPLLPDASGIPFAAQGFLLNEFGSIPLAAVVSLLALELVVINCMLAAGAAWGANFIWNQPSFKRP